MKEYVTRTMFVDGFKECNRENNFSYWGRLAMWDYFEDLEEAIGEEITYDPIAICCDYTEYENLEELNKDYDKDFKDIEEVKEYTDVIEFQKLENMKYVYGGFIVRCW